ncbi:MAG: SAF domain-containing protein [Actinomycetota bacterium]
METATAESTDNPTAVRAITPRRSLPSGRALIGAFLVTVAALGAFVVATGGDDGPTTSFLVTTRDLAAGDTITIADVRFEPMTLSSDLAGRSLNSTDGLDGATVLRDFRAGELIDVADVIGAIGDQTDGPDATLHEVTIGVPLERTPASLREGDRITLLGTAGATTRVAVEDALVLDIDREPDQIGLSGTGILTIAIDEPDVVLTVAHISQTTDITIVLSTRALTDVFPTTFTSGDDS